ncbi:T9SS type A sorting domain-containing protein, partial [Pseudopedobacter sp.]|uniref:T9SS type A sorting domain-containing protein n=1 Tax=Pseudopedobacter sp. TaxID=1936787 RepID=UPI003341E1D3
EDPVVFTGTSFLGQSAAYPEIFNTFRWVVTNTVEGDKTIKFQYRRKNTPTSVQSYVDISSTTFEQGKTYNVEIICNNTDQTQEFMLNAISVNINSRRTMVVVDGNIVAVEDLASAAKDDQIYSNVMPVNNVINSFAFAGHKGSGTVTPDSEITLSNISWNYVKPSVLPVSFISFTGKNTSEGVQLNWETASEENNSRFEIYRSNDGQTFSKIGSLAGSLNSNQINSYSFIDDSPFQGGNYYQLKQVDADGKSSTYAKTVFVTNSFGKEEFNAFVSQDKQINLKIFSDKSERVSVCLTDVTGRVIYQGGTTLRQNENRIQLPLIPLIPGIYVVSMVNEDNKARTTKIIL